MCARVRVFTPNFSALRKKAAVKCNDLPGPLVYKVQTVYNKSLFTFVCLMYQQYNDTFHELRMQLESQVVQIP